MSTRLDTQLYIDGKLRAAASAKTYDNISPWTGQPVGKAAAASAEDVSEAIAAARRAFDETDWARDPARRFQLLTKLQAVFAANVPRLTQIARDEIGATIMVASRIQVGMALAGWKDLLEAFAGVRWKEDRGRKGPEGAISHRFVLREGAGVVGAITPFNVPLYANIEKIVSALLAGCTVVLKPSPDTPALGAIWGEFADEVGLPAGVLNVVTGPGPEVGELLVTDPRVDLISFTGSSAVGMRIMEKGAGTLKRVLLELGGKSARILLDDVPNFAQEVAASILVTHAGQGCAANSRLLVPRSRYDEAIAALRSAYSGCEGKWGRYDDPDNIMGPLVSKKQLDRVKGHVDAGIADGATLLSGGSLRPDLPGYFIEPTCFIDVTSRMRIAREEIFGPVLAVLPYKDEEDAVRIANDSDYGLSGSVFTGDVERGLQLASRIRTGTIGVNGGRCIDGDLPFGGYKHSGLGRAWGTEGIEEYTEAKVIAYKVVA